MSRPRFRRRSRYIGGQLATHHLPPKPKVKVEPESPFIKAAWEGDVSFVRGLLKGFPGAIDVNHTAAVNPLYGCKSLRSSRRIYQHSHNCTALHAAVCNGHLDVVQVLLESGASVNISNCRHSTPLHEATEQNSLEMVKTLHKHGAHIDVANENGSTPLCIALANTDTDIVRYLLEAGASTLAPNPAGLSAMHVAAASGHLEGIKLLLSYGASPMFSEPSPSSEGYIPCPLYLAAVCQHSDVVTDLSAHPECPPACRADALLVLGSQKVSFYQILKKEQERKLLGEVKELWEQALKIREKHQLTPKFLPPMSAYNNAVEIQTLDDHKQLFGSKSIEAIPFQALIIRERCVGYLCIPKSDRRQNRESLFYELMSVCYSLHDDTSEHCDLFEGLVLKSSESLVKIITHPTNHSVSVCDSFSDQLLNYVVLFEVLVSKMCQCIQQLLKGGSSPQFEKHIRLTLKILEHLQLKCSTGAPCGDDKTRRIIRSYPQNQAYPSILFLFLRWMLHSSLSTIREEDETVGSDACEASGREFVNNHLDTSSMGESTLLNFALKNKFHIRISSMERKEAASTFPVLIVALLRWGADAVINVPDQKGHRPLHLAAQLDNPTIVSHLLDYGAHLDAVNAEGKAFYEVLKTFPTDNPLPLVCHASRKIVSEGIPYQNLDLPRHVKEFVRLHDPTQ